MNGCNLIKVALMVLYTYILIRDGQTQTYIFIFFMLFNWP